MLGQQCVTWSSTFRRLEFGRDFLFFRKMLNLCLKCTLAQALRLCTGRTAHRESRGVALLFHDHDTRRGEGSASRPGCSLLPGMSRYLLYRRRGGPRAGLDRCGKSRSKGIRSPGRPVRSQSLYRLSYPVHKPVIGRLVSVGWDVPGFCLEGIRKTTKTPENN